MLLLCSQRHFKNEFRSLFCLSFLWFLQIWNLIHKPNIYFMILYSGMHPPGSFYICNKINCSKRETLLSSANSSCSVKIWWNEFHWSQLDSAPLERASTVFRSQEEADLPPASLCWRQENVRLKITRIIPTIQLNNFPKIHHLLKVEIRQYQFSEAEKQIFT